MTSINSIGSHTALVGVSDQKVDEIHDDLCALQIAADFDLVETVDKLQSFIDRIDQCRGEVGQNVYAYLARIRSCHLLCQALKDRQPPIQSGITLDDIDLTIKCLLAWYKESGETLPQDDTSYPKLMESIEQIIGHFFKELITVAIWDHREAFKALYLEPIRGFFEQIGSPLLSQADIEELSEVCWDLLDTDLAYIGYGSRDLYRTPQSEYETILQTISELSGSNPAAQEAIAKLEDVEHVKLSGIDFSYLRDLKDLLEKIQYSVQSLELSDCNLTGSAERPLMQFMVRAQKLTELTLTGGKLRSSAVHPLIVAINNSGSKLERLDLSDNDIDSEGLFSLIVLSQTSTHLKHVNLSRNRVDTASTNGRALQIMVDSRIRSKDNSLESFNLEAQKEPLDDGNTIIPPDGSESE